MPPAEGEEKNSPLSQPSPSADRLQALKEELHDLRGQVQTLSLRVATLWRLHQARRVEGGAMAKTEHVEPLRPEALAGVPGLNLGDLLKYTPVLEKVIQAFVAGSGTFSSWSPRGKVWVRVQTHPFEDTAP